MQYERLSKQHQGVHVEDAKTYLQEQLGLDKFKRVVFKQCLALADHDETVANRHLVVCADQYKREELANGPKDFIRNPELFPRVPIYTERQPPQTGDDR